MYFKLALGNVRKSIRDYGIYFLTLVFGVCIFYAFGSFTQQGSVLALDDMQSNVIELLSTLINGVSIFIAVILGFLIVYASRYLIKRRKKEFGTYLCLGMASSKVSRIIVYETLIVGLGALVVGLGAGFLLSQLLLYITASLFVVEMNMFVFVYSAQALINTLICFGIIFLIALVFNVFSVSRYRLIDLIYADRKNESMKLRSIPLSIILFIISLVFIVVAYVLLLDNGMQQFDTQFAFATALVCVGTCLLFYSVAGFLLRAVQSRKKLYFHGLNMFTMRQLNAKINTAFVSITLVCMTLFLAITSTCGGFSLCSAFTQNLEATSVYDASFSAYYEKNTSSNEAEDRWLENAKAYNYDMKTPLKHDIANWDELVASSAQIDFYASETSFQYIFDHSSASGQKARTLSDPANTYLDLVPLSQYNALREMNGLDALDLAENEYILWCDAEDMQKTYRSFLEGQNVLSFSGKTLRPADHELETLLASTSTFAMQMGSIVVPDALISQKSTPIYALLNVMYQGDREDFDPLITAALTSAYGENFEGANQPFSFYITALEIHSQSSGMSLIIAYLAIYIGFVLLIACAAILALQQLSEAADNASRYQLLAKLGTDKKMINKALFTQVGIYFLFPLVVALAHSLVALSVVVNIASRMGHFDIAGPLGATVILFVAIYGGYFLLTYFASKTMIHSASKK